MLAPAPATSAEAKARACALAEELAAERPGHVVAVGVARRAASACSSTGAEVERGELVFDAAAVLERIERLGDLLA